MPKKRRPNVESDSGITAHDLHEGQALPAPMKTYSIRPHLIVQSGSPGSDITYSFGPTPLITLHLSQWTPTPTCLQALLDLISNLEGKTR